MERVESKNLFNFKLEGVRDPECDAWEKDMAAKYPKDIWDMSKKTPAEVADIIRQGIAMLGEVAKHPTLKAAEAACENSKFVVPPRDGNDASVPVFVSIPKTLAGRKDKAAVIFAHGGGCVAGDAEIVQAFVSSFAVECDVVYFNVDYRIAPETKCPNNALDFYCAVKHIVENASEFGIDPSKIAIHGESGGGYVAGSALVMMAQKNEGHLIKLAILAIAMIDDYEFGDPASMTNDEKQNCVAMRKIWECIATDLDAQRKSSDPLLFPAKANEDLLQKFPPTIIWEFEFDMYITSNIRMATRLRNAGRLLELYILPGALHSSGSDPNFKIFKKNIDHFKLAIDTYLK